MIISENLSTPVESHYDVAVCGGGVAGIAAALASARGGAKTVLFERQFILGGLATAGLITIYLPLCDGMGHQVSFGIAEELFRLSILHGAEAGYPENWLDGVGSRTKADKRFQVQFNPHLFAILCEKLLIEAGVEIIYGSYVAGTRVENEKITHLITEGKSGRRAYSVGRVVDATGDCDVGYLSGVPTVEFCQGNLLASWYYYIGKDGYCLNTLGFADIPEEEKRGTCVEALIGRRFSGLDTKEISEMTCLSHGELYKDFLKRRKSDAGLFPVTIPTIPQLRMTRRIDGESTPTTSCEGKYFEDSIGVVSNWKKRGPIYEVPFSSLWSRACRNLICAGRCTSCDEAMWDVMRVIPCCAVTGQAAGTAAAMCDDFGDIDIVALQRRLESDGVVLHINQLF